MRYLLVTHIPFARIGAGPVTLDRLWSLDLDGLSESIGPITVAAPCLPLKTMRSWGADFAERSADSAVRFVALPARKSRFDFTYGVMLRSALRSAVSEADLVHTSNLFGHDMALYFGHDLATREGKKTLFVVAEDFPDMLGWEWVRTAKNGFSRWRRQQTLDRLDREVRKRIRTSSMVFLHTPAAVSRYRIDAQNAFAIRQPVHEANDIIEADVLDRRFQEFRDGGPLRIVTASRLLPLKGIDLLIRAVALLRDRSVRVELTLYGSGEQAAELERLIERLKLGEQVRLGGSLEQGAALRQALEQNDVFAMPHLTTDFGRAFFDAMAAALPVIAFRSPASSDTVRDGIDGLLVANADVEALASGIARLAQNPNFVAELSRNARQRATENTRTVWNNLRASWIRDLF